MRNREEKLLWPAAAAGLVGGLVIAVAESLLVVAKHGWRDPGVFLFAGVAYGLFGLGGGIGLGILFSLVGRRLLGSATAAALGGATVVTLFGTVIGRFLVFRDLLDEKIEGRVMAFQVGTLALALVLFSLTYLLIRRWAKRPAALVLSLPRVLGVAGAALCVFAAATVFSPDEGARIVERTRPAAPAGAPNIILIIVDTLRADHLSCYGYREISTPAIDRLAADGTRFAKAFAQASWTRPSIASILTSLYPSSHQAVHKADALPEGVATLAEVLAQAGYYAAGFANNANVAPVFNFHQGFDEYHFLAPAFFFYATRSASELAIYNQLRMVRERFLSQAKYVEHYYQPAEVVTDRALEWLGSAQERPFFLMIHYMDPHDPYFVHPFDGEGYARVADPNPPKERAELYRRLYDGEIVYLDHHLARLFDGLRQRGLYEDSIIALTADHGEEFFEHGGWWHGQTLFEEQVHVPLIIKGTGRTGAGNVNNALVTSLDVAPTLIALAGVAVPQQMQGKALVLRPGQTGGRDAVFAEEDFEGNVLFAVRTETWKRIAANPGNPRGLPREQLFKIDSDPGEREDLAARNREVASELAAKTDTFKREAKAEAVESAGASVDAATKERLRALGYVN